MKIAIAFFGLPRCSRITYPSIVENILKTLPSQAQVECFYHFYLQKEVINTHSKENGSLDESNYHDFKKYQGQLENPADVLPHLNFEELKQFGSAWNDDFTNLKNLLLQLHSLSKVTEFIESYDPDCVLYVRPDLLYHDPFESIYYEICLKTKNSVFVPWWQWGIGLNDRFAIVHRDAYRVYGKRIHEALNYCREGNRPLHSERLLKYALLKQNKKIFTLDVKASRVRINGDIVQEKFATNISLFSPISNPHKRFLFLAQLKTKLKVLLAKIAS